ncbi:MAG TPA: S41 family peptidase [Longimicrobium sp.]|jgi:C-terminal processing protease CtpA/Prc|uniref:S41 family peptidase n=1 Tax=Longimicrobium sp. TaxID=2029185 RepID=UPI002EDAB39B
MGYAELFERIWSTIDSRFYDPDFAGVDWRAAGERYRPRVAAISSDTAFHGLMTQMLRELPVSHLELTRPPLAASYGPAIGTRMVDGREVVVVASPLSDAYRRGVRVGDVLLTPLRASRGPLGDSVSLRWESCGGEQRQAAVRRERITPTRPAAGPTWFVVEMAPDRRIGYLRVPNFFDGTAAQADSAMAGLAGTHGLVIDVRDNPGGNTSFVRLASYFTEGSNMVAALLMRSALRRYGGAPDRIDPAALPRVRRTYTDRSVFVAMLRHRGAVAVFTEDVGARRYTAPVAVLTNEYTVSAAEGFAAYMQFRRAATLVGAPTAGRLLGGEQVPLGGGWSLFLPTHAAWGPDGRSAIDRVTVPDVAEPLTREAVCARRDPALERAFALLGGQR